MTAWDSQQFSPDIVLVQPRDPVVLRDARPFTADPGAHAFSLPFPFPQTIAGAVRTCLGSGNGFDWNDPRTTSLVHQSEMRGPILVAQPAVGGPWTPYVAAPRDVVFYRVDPRAVQLHHMLLRPHQLANDEGVSAPLMPIEQSEGCRKASERVALEPLSVTEDVKPASNMPAWWSLNDAISWLNKPEPSPPIVSSAVPGEQDTVRGLPALAADIRTHVKIDSQTGAHEHGALFTVESRVFPDAPSNGQPALALLSRVVTSLDWPESERLIWLGGERRTALLRVNPPGVSWPEVVYPSQEDIEAADGIRLLFATPALFRHGWLPDWMANGVIPGTNKMKAQVKLVGAAADRRIPVSGWRMAARDRSGTPVPPGPRATRYAVPAGSVYFLEFEHPHTDHDWWKELWNKLWLAPVSDFATDCDDGYGLVLPGLWKRRNS